MLWFSYYFVVPPESRDARIHGIGILTRKIYKMTQFKKKITGTETRDPEITAQAQINTRLL